MTTLVVTDAWLSEMQCQRPQLVLKLRDERSKDYAPILMRQSLPTTDDTDELRSFLNDAARTLWARFNVEWPSTPTPVNPNVFLGKRDSGAFNLRNWFTSVAKPA